MKNWTKAVTAISAVGAFASASRIVERPTALAFCLFLACAAWLSLFVWAQQTR